MSTGSLNLSVSLLETYFSTRGYKFEKLTLNEAKFTRFLPANGSPWLVRNGSVSYPFLSSTCLKISNRKDLAYKFCDALGVRVPKTYLITGSVTTKTLNKYLQEGPLVVKPHDGAMSKGVTLGITDVSTLKQAIVVAKQYSDTVIVQEQVTGEEIRFVVVDGTVQAALLRQTPRVTGNGRDDVEELLVDENISRNKLRMPYLEYPELGPDVIDLQEEIGGYVPDTNEVVELGRGTMIKTGASVYDVHDRVHKSYKDVAEKLAQALDARFIVVDMMINKFEQPKTKNNYAFLEFNTSPALKLFYSCRDGKHFDALSHLGPIITESLQITA